jgi:hypothetical protein
MYVCMSVCLYLSSYAVNFVAFITKPLVRSCSEPVESNSLLDVVSFEIRFNIIFLSTCSTGYFVMTLLSEGYSVPGRDAV